MVIVQSGCVKKSERHIITIKEVRKTKTMPVKIVTTSGNWFE